MRSNFSEPVVQDSMPVIPAYFQARVYPALLLQREYFFLVRKRWYQPLGGIEPRECLSGVFIVHYWYVCTALKVHFVFAVTSTFAPLFPRPRMPPASSLFQANRAQAFERRGEWSKALSDYEGEDHGGRCGGIHLDECLVSFARLSVDQGVQR